MKSKEDVILLSTNPLYSFVDRGTFTELWLMDGSAAIILGRHMNCTSRSSELHKEHAACLL